MSHCRKGERRWRLPLALSYPSGFQAPDFTLPAYLPDRVAVQNIRLADLRGQWVLLFFCASDFTFV